MAEAITVARPYAVAAWRHAQTEGKADLWTEMLDGEVDEEEDGVDDELDQEVVEGKIRRAIEEAIAINQELGDVSRVHELRWKEAEIELKTGEIETYRKKCIEICQWDLERGDFDYAVEVDLSAIELEIETLIESMEDEEEGLAEDDIAEMETELETLGQIWNELKTMIRKEAESKKQEEVLEHLETLATPGTSETAE